MDSTIERLKDFVQRVFKTSMGVFLEALKLSRNAQGYVCGSITELLIRNQLQQDFGCEVRRIREKWEGKKAARHHGDWYFRKPDGPWYVLESKGIKSNSEKWHKLYNFDRLKRFLIAHSDLIPGIDTDRDVERQVVEWIRRSLPLFATEYEIDLYEYEEVQSYRSSRDTRKARAIEALRDLTREEVSERIRERLQYLGDRVKVLETHFVSGRSAISERTQATPRKDEFNVVAVDIFLRYPEHKFLYANPKNLESSGDDANHLQQNYVLGLVFEGGNGSELRVYDEWYTDFEEVYASLDPSDCIEEKDMQVDNRLFENGEDIPCEI